MGTTVEAPATEWPTLNKVNAVVGAIADATDCLDQLSSECYGLTANDDTPYEPVEGVPEPTIEDVGALARLVLRVEHEIETQQLALETFRKLLDAAVYRSHPSDARAA